MSEKVALITGGAKRIGLALSLHLLKKNYIVWVHSRTSSQFDEIRSLFSDFPAYKVRHVHADLRNPCEISLMFDEIARKTGLDLLINNASVFQDGKIDQATVAQWDEMMNVNLRALWLCSSAAVPMMKARAADGLILNMADSGGYQEWVNAGIYSLTQSAVLALTRICAKTFAPAVRVNSISPGLILKDDATSDGKWDALQGKLLIGKDMNDEQRIHAVLHSVDFLLDSPLITGVDIPCDGGYRLKVL